MQDRVQLHRAFLLTSKRILRWSEYCFLIIGGLALSWYGLAKLDIYVYQSYLSRFFDRALNQKTALTPKQGGVSHLKVALHEASLLGRMQIPRLGVWVMVLEGAEEKTLRQGAGHIPGTAWPGESGNVGIAAHRDTFFRKLRHIRNGDQILLSTLDQLYTYIVDYTEVVEPEDVHVLAASMEPCLTLVTCYPFDFVGSAPRRFIVRAHRRVDSTVANRGNGPRANSTAER